MTQLQQQDMQNEGTPRTLTSHLIPVQVIQKQGFIERIVRDIFKNGGVEFDGSEAWDIQVNDPRVYRRIALSGSLGMGESYMDGWWDCDRLDELFTKILKADIRSASKHKWPGLTLALKSLVLNRQSQSHAFEVGERHYDLGNDLYEAMLDPRMTYTCGYWKTATNLNDAQEAKLDLVCRKIGLQEGQRVLDVGCGWGSFAKFAAERYGAQVVGITISREQAAYARESCRNLPVEIHLQDYRECYSSFDKVVSLGMMEHVGQRNYGTYFKMMHDCLRPGGLALVQAIGSRTSQRDTDPWLDRYIFPNSMLPSARQIGKALDGLFDLQDWHAFGLDYDKTLMAWHANFEQAWSQLSKNYDERFRRMWRYYLMFCAGIFRSGEAQLWQVVMSKGLPAGRYEAVR